MLLSVGLMMRAAVVGISLLLAATSAAVAVSLNAPAVRAPSEPMAMAPLSPVAVASTPDVNLQVANIYLAFKRRQPSDREWGLGALLMNHAGPGALIDKLSLSEEWLGPFVDDIYRRALNREPDPTGRAYWISQLQTGLTTKQILDPILDSAEFQASTAANNAEVVARMYRQILERDVDPEGAAYWNARIAAVGAKPVAAALFDSPENRRRQVSAFYQLLLCRDADEAGLNYWADRVGQGRDMAMAKAIATTPEFLNATNSCGIASLVGAGPEALPDDAELPLDPLLDPTALLDPLLDPATLVDPSIIREPQPASLGQTWTSTGGTPRQIAVTRSGFSVTDLETGKRRTLVGVPIHVSGNGQWALTQDGVTIRVHNLVEGTSEVVETDWATAKVALYRVGNDGSRTP